MQVLTESQWRERAAAHEARVDSAVAAHLSRRRDHRKHPVEDFLFTYYSFTPAQLRRWHPGAGTALTPQLVRPSGSGASTRSKATS